MVQSQYGITWEGYKNNIYKGFSALQQNNEFVDMTLAADGHFVKVHQMLLALASPYFKELIQSAPCPHPVIFLNNVTYHTLSSLLEYIYTGEVLLPAENLSNFIKTAKALHIFGIDDTVEEACDNSLESNVQLEVIPDDEIDDDDGNLRKLLPQASEKIAIRNELSRYNITPSSKIEYIEDDYSDTLDVSMQNDPDGDDYDQQTTQAQIDSIKARSNLQFTLSNCGHLQVILNRYIYYLYSTAHRTGIRRWRCVNYKTNKCKAFIVTKDNRVLNRANLHNHEFHDKKILSKIQKNTVYSAMEEVKDLNSKNVTVEAKETSEEDN